MKRRVGTTGESPQREGNGMADHIEALLDMDELVPVMDAQELARLWNAVRNGEKPDFSPDEMAALRDRAAARRAELNARFGGRTPRAKG